MYNANITTYTQCDIMPTFIRKPPIAETKNPEKEIDNLLEEKQGVIVDGELRFYDGELADVSEK